MTERLPSVPKSPEKCFSKLKAAIQKDPWFGDSDIFKQYQDGKLSESQLDRMVKRIIGDGSRGISIMSKLQELESWKKYKTIVGDLLQSTQEVQAVYTWDTSDFAALFIFTKTASERRNAKVFLTVRDIATASAIARVPLVPLVMPYQLYQEGALEPISRHSDHPGDLQELFNLSNTIPATAAQS